MHAAVLATGTPPPVPDLLARLEAVARRTAAALQAVDAEVVLNERHVASAALHAERAIEQGRSSARSLATEFLLYLTGERQVRRALEAAGVREGTRALVIVAFGPAAEQAAHEAVRALGLRAETAPWPPNPRALERLGARDELSLLQRVALVDLLK